LRFGTLLRGGPAEKRDMKRVTESRGADLRESGAQSAGRIRNAARRNFQFRVVCTGNMAEFVNNSTLLCHHQHEQKAKSFEKGFHST
jgi:hypothetical protein